LLPRKRLFFLVIVGPTKYFKLILLNLGRLIVENEIKYYRLY
jgi:hypothetical protein